MTDPLVVEFEVGVAPSRAFELWTRRCASWWPPSHTVSGRPESITFEPRTGGRIFERGPDGQEHDWGEVLDWERLGQTGVDRRTRTRQAWGSLGVSFARICSTAAG